MDPAAFNRYLDTCDPASDRECGGWILDGKPMKTYESLFPFRRNASHLTEHPCDRFLIGSNASLVIPAADRPKPGDHCYERCSLADQIVNLYFTIPEPDIGNSSAPAKTVGGPLTPHPWVGELFSQTVATATTQAVPSSTRTTALRPTGTSGLPVPGSPAESLYCSIVEFFGGTCT